MAIPIDVNNYSVQYFTNGGSKEMDVDGSGPPVSFTLEGLVPGQRYYLQEVSLYIEDSTNMESDEFGALVALTNGVLMRSGSGPGIEITLLKDNQDIHHFFSVWQQSPVLKDNDQQHFMVRERFDNPIIITDEVEVLIQDDLTGLDFFRIAVKISTIPSGT